MVAEDKNYGFRIFSLFWNQTRYVLWCDVRLEVKDQGSFDSQNCRKQHRIEQMLQILLLTVTWNNFRFQIQSTKRHSYSYLIFFSIFSLPTHVSSTIPFTKLYQNCAYAFQLVFLWFENLEERHVFHRQPQ